MTLHYHIGVMGSDLYEFSTSSYVQACVAALGIEAASAPALPLIDYQQAVHAGCAGMVL
jgi:hypothetical protein